ncbi:16S rRNA (uracil(1498)-N(3))-methyltransferase [Arthrobacter bambusae]|uniref:16S rRNA (uracil(1498)-N(3))-methyltransferase n=1 Tax=Arthrobacter TaxID=1663 RepID=UPI0009913A9D|nr:MULTISPECIES: 16S rRNA (uracil(1498)-N(3))-methyltransferase [Arthrobacter]MCI0143385.1 16S rRNA (uracil(1498)-N(3))-methyltransferase [Arthrobacter bambusae]OOP65197.1 16S rRNA (uracil(1498)-N(3))-methyltransferase [Arthrobacter sp. SRS-W-1-2016]UYY79851.1 16S rRNA (uracil(1498)-N(3))-methyltransferase [Arthrobacter sp. YA7-1]
MSNPVFFTAAGTLDGLGTGDTFVLDGAEARHAVTVKRLEIGEAVDIADGAGKRLTGTVAGSGQGTLTVLASAVQEEGRPAVRLVLVQALAKGDRDELAVETATELGIDAVVPWQAERSIVRWKGDRAAKAHAKWQSVATAAAKQARRAWIPEVRAAVDGSGLAAAVAAADLAIILHEDAKRPLRDVLENWRGGISGEDTDAGREVLLIVGPEGGISPREVTKLSDVGAVTALLGHHVLRSSTAGPAAVVLASDILGRW